MWNWLVHLFHDRKHFNPHYQHKHCLLQSFFATLNTLHQDHTSKEKHSIPFAFYGKSSKRNKTQPLCVVLCMLQGVQLLTIYRVTVYGCTNLLSKASWSPSSQLLQWLQDRQSVQGPEAHGPAEAASDSAKRSCQPACLSKTKIFRFLSKSINSRVKRQEGERVTSSHKYIYSTALSYHFSITFLLYGP